ncbi:RNA polymerase sigma factor [Virgisporangium aurantiacum]|uniref:RNA polymerase sigma factor n=1 Tax=Virgisporangium aurantiacum TaxID=175570 RepID=A0A8J3Z5X7_9ACTN|nr:sigma-70 family RNA polymerase sigma factor [Virgisporangium aurantiacum]GIJ56943.1 RNA polymerase sigma factor [Virgisporangium aurantiacum]
MNENHPVGKRPVAAADGMEHAWKAVVDRYAPVVCAVVRAYRLEPADAKIVSQMVWLRLADDFDLSHDPATLRTWLVTTTRQECVRIIHRRGQAEPPAIDAELRRVEQLQALRDGLAELAPEDRNLLMMVARDPAISDDHLGRLLHIPVDDVGPMRSRSLARLRATPSMRDLGHRPAPDDVTPRSTR